MYDIYLIKNKINGKKYVGYTSKGYEKRFKSHIKEAKENRTKRYLCQAIRKYGEENFSIELLDKGKTHEEAKEKEKYYIDKFNTFVQSKGSWGYNGTKGGDGANGVNFPKSVRLKISESRIKAGSWRGKNNPNFGKGHLMRGKHHFNYGKRHSEETRMKISISTMGKYVGENNPASIKEITLAKHVVTGVIQKAESFYDMGVIFKSLGYKFNRSSVLRSIRSGKHSIYDHVFYREDITDKTVFNQILHEKENNICVPPELPDYGNGKNHPNAKNEISFAVNAKTNDIYRFDSWYDCKNYIADNFNEKISYSDMYKVAIGKRKSARDFIFYRADLNKDDIPKLEKAYLLKTFND